MATKTELPQTVAAISATPNAYGITFNRETVHKDGKSYQVPMLVVTDTALFATHFPGVVKEQMTAASSLRVGVQALVRTEASRNPTVKYDALVELIIRRKLLGENAARGGSRVEYVYVVPMFGKQYPHPLSATDAAEMLAKLIDHGFDGTVARDILAMFA